MTLIVNVLHKDFSLLAGDRLANATGPATITIGAMTISMPNGGKIIGAYPKLVTTPNRAAAIGGAGTVSEHRFMAAVQSADSPLQALSQVRNAIHESFSFEERDRYLDSQPQMVNEALLTFFDEEKAAFWTFVFKYTRFESHQFPYARRANPEAQVFWLGSGGNALREQFPAETIQAFVDALREDWTETQLAEWLDEIYSVVATHNDTVSAEYDGLIATRDESVFRPLRRER